MYSKGKKYGIFLLLCTVNTNKKGVRHMHYGITSASQIIDIAGIRSGIEKIKSTAADFNDCATAVNAAADICNAEALAIEGKTMQPTINELAEQIKSIQSSVEELADSILSVANQVYNAQNAELQEYQERLRREAEAKKNG